jgi:hypothetical protein
MAKSQWSFKTAIELSAALAAKKVSAVELARSEAIHLCRKERWIASSLRSSQ